MVNYLPERIYNKIKDDERFIELDKVIQDFFASLNTLTDIVYKDTGTRNNENLYNLYISTINSLVDEYCPEYKLQTRITIDPTITKDQLIGWYESDNMDYDLETKFYILSYIINNSFQDRTFAKYQNEYFKLYDSLTDEQTGEFPSYIHLKYMVSKVERYAVEDAPKDMTFISKVTELLDYLYNKLYLKIGNPLIKYAYIELYDHNIGNALQYIDDWKVYEQIRTTNLREDLIDESFDGYSIPQLGIIDKKFEMAFSIRDFDMAYTHYKEACEFIDKAMENPSKLFETLCIYDKIMAPNYSALVRRILKLSETTLLGSYEFKNINPVDYEFLSRKDYNNIELSNQATSDSFIRLTKHMDDWFTNNEQVLSVFSNWYKYELSGQELPEVE